MSVLYGSDSQEMYHHTKDHAIDSELLAMPSVVFEQEHVSSTAQEEE